MQNQKGFILPILIIVSLLILAVIAYFFSPKSISLALPTPTPVVLIDEQSKTYSNYSYYVNKEASFSIDYPKFLRRYEYDYSRYGKPNKISKIILFCENEVSSDLENGSIRCINGGGFSIWYNGDGWGGGCDPENHKLINILDKSNDYCLYSDGFGQLYVNTKMYKNDYDEFALSGVFSNTFNRIEMEKTISTFKFTQ